MNSWSPQLNTVPNQLQDDWEPRRNHPRSLRMFRELPKCLGKSLQGRVAIWHSRRLGGRGYIEAIGSRYLFCGRRSLEGAAPDSGWPPVVKMPGADPGEG